MEKVVIILISRFLFGYRVAMHGVLRKELPPKSINSFVKIPNSNLLSKSLALNAKQLGEDLSWVIKMSRNLQWTSDIWNLTIQSNLLFLTQKHIFLPIFALSDPSSNSFWVNIFILSIHSTQFWKQTILTAANPFAIIFCKSVLDGYSTLNPFSDLIALTTIQILIMTTVWKRPNTYIKSDDDALLK